MEREAVGRVVWRWVIRVPWVRIEWRVVVEMNSGVAEAAAVAVGSVVMAERILVRE